MQATSNGPVDLSRAWSDVQERNVAMNHPNPLQALHSPSNWMAEFSNGPQMHNSAPAAQTQVPNFRQQSYMSPQLYGSMGQGFMHPMNFAAGPVQVSAKGKGKAREIDFDAAFAELDQALGPSPQEMAKIEEWDDVADLNEVMERARIQDLKGPEAVSSDFTECVDHRKNSTN